MTKKKLSIPASILVALSIVSIVLLGYLEFVLIKFHLFPVMYRWIIFGIGFGLSLLLLILGLIRGGKVQKIVGIILCCVLIFTVDVFTLYAQKTGQTFQDIQANSEKNLAKKRNSSKKNDQHEAKNVTSTDQSFIVYVSGNDTYGKLEDESRSDVNILVTVNPKTRKVLLLSVPRDSYLPIAGGGNFEKDKLTHAGIYGIDASIKTLEKALDLQVNYYVRLNFTSFIDIIDVIGGIQLNNPTAFTAFDGKEFPAGTLNLNGDQALSFVRERKSLDNGDFSRQKNQERVIEATFHKILSPELVFKFQGIMNAISNSVETNMPPETIMNFVNSQIDYVNDWKFDTIFIDGSSATGLPSYAMPGYDLWFFVPDEDSMKEAHDKIKAVYDGVEMPDHSTSDEDTNR